MFVGCFEISISVIVKHVGSKLVKQVLVSSEIFVCLGGPVKIFSAWEGGGGGQRKLLGCCLLEGRSVPWLTLRIAVMKTGWFSGSKVNFRRLCFHFDHGSFSWCVSLIAPIQHNSTLKMLFQPQFLYTL